MIPAILDSKVQQIHKTRNTFIGALFEKYGFDLNFVKDNPEKFEIKLFELSRNEKWVTFMG